MEFSNLGFYTVIMLAIGLFVFFRFLTWLVPLLMKRERRRHAWRYTSLIELFVWIIFLVWSINFLSENNPWYATGLFVILFAFTIYAAWIGLKDFVAGALFKTSNNFSLNETIRVGDFNGKIISFGHSWMVLETESGETIFLPYSYLFGKVIMKSHPAETILSHTFRLVISKSTFSVDAIGRIQNFILTLPWASLKKEPQIKPVEETYEAQILEITVFSIEKEYFQEIETEVKQKFGTALKTAEKP